MDNRKLEQLRCVMDNRKLMPAEDWTKEDFEFWQAMMEMVRHKMRGASPHATAGDILTVSDWREVFEVAKT